MSTHRQNITLKQLQDLVVVAEMQGRGKHKTITIQLTHCNPADILEVSIEWDSEKYRINDFDAL